MRGSNSRPPDYETDALPTELTEQAVHSMMQARRSEHYIICFSTIISYT